MEEKTNTYDIFEVIDEDFDKIVDNDEFVDATIHTLVVRSEWDKIDYFDAVEYIAKIFPQSLVEQLWQLVHGPVYDGDVISKSDRDRLFDMGIAIKVCKDGEDSYNGSKNIGYSILKEMDELDYGETD